MHVCLISVCQPNSKSSHTRLAFRVRNCIVYRLYANLIRNHRILGWHPGLRIYHYEDFDNQAMIRRVQGVRLYELEISQYEDFKLPSYDQKGYRGKNMIQISVISNIKRRKPTAKIFFKSYMPR